MTGWVHFIQSFKGIWIKMLLLSLGLFLFQMLFSLLATSPQIQTGILKDLNDIPPIVEKMMGEGFIDALVKYGVIAVGYLHPFMLVLFIIYILVTVSHVLTAEITHGTIGFTLSKPISRMRIIFNLALLVYLGLAVLAVSTFMASGLGVFLLHSKKLTIVPFLSLSWNIFLLMVFLSGYIVVVAAISDSSKKLYTITGLLLVSFYLINLSSPLFLPLKFISPLNPFSYFKPMAILVGQRINLTDSIMIVLVSLFLFAVAACLFKKKDLASG